MSISKYTIKSNDVIHNTSADFVKRIVSMPIHLMQYDDTLPIIAVELFENENPYTLPNIQNINMYVRWGLKDHTFVYKPILGCDDNRHIIYFAVDEQMVFYDGELNEILELVIEETFIDGNEATYNKRTIGSSYIKFIIDKNPIQKSDIAAVSRYAHLVENVIPNPAVAGGEPELTSIGLGAQNYIISGGGSGGTVIPNPPMPVGEDFPNLHGLKVGNDKYSVFSMYKRETENGEDSEIDGIVFVKI